MALYSVQVLMGADSALPKHRLVNTLHFNGVGTIFALTNTGAQAVADGVRDAYSATVAGTPREITVKVYDLDDDKPRPIKATAVANVGSYPLSPCPREVALCLSFYADRNLPRQRGRIYIPACVIGGTIGVKPTNTQMDAALALYNRLKDVGGTDLEWSVYSRRDNEHRQVQHGWCDDEWDTQRSRGLDPSTRRTVTAEG